MVSTDPADPTNVTTLATRKSTFDVETLRSIESMDDALAAINARGITIKDAAEYLGDGFELLDEKDKVQLVGLPFLILEGTEAAGDYGRTFVSLRIITKDGRKLILNDGGTGIRDQVVDFLTRNETVTGLAITNGLRESKYRFCDPEQGGCRHINKDNAAQCVQCGHSPLSPASTFYLDTSKSK